MKNELSFIGVGIAFVGIFILSFFVDIEILKSYVAQSGVWAPLAFIALKMSTLIIAPLSGATLYPLAGVLFDFWPGLIYSSIADFLGLTVAFFISRYIGLAAVFRITKQHEGGMLSRILEQVSTTKGFLIACILFIPMPELLAYASGLTRLPYATFILILFPLWTLASMTLIFIGSLF